MLLWEKVVPGQPPSSSNDDQLLVLRLKGILCPPKDAADASDRQKCLIVQGVQDLYDIQEGFVHENQTEDLASKLVLIGKNLDKNVLLQSFKQYVKVDAS